VRVRFPPWLRRRRLKAKRGKKANPYRIPPIQTNFRTLRISSVTFDMTVHSTCQFLLTLQPSCVANVAGALGQTFVPSKWAAQFKPFLRWVLVGLSLFNHLDYLAVCCQSGRRATTTLLVSSSSTRAVGISMRFLRLSQSLPEAHYHSQ
jgi:hypothetical protein